MGKPIQQIINYAPLHTHWGKNIGMLPMTAGMGSRKLRSSWRWIWQRLWRIWTASTGTMLRKWRQNCLINETRDLVTTNTEKEEVFSNFFCLCFHWQLLFCVSSLKAEGNIVPPTIRDLELWDYLRNLNMHKSLGTNEMHPKILREWFGVIASPQSIVFANPWLSDKGPRDCKNRNIRPIFQRRKPCELPISQVHLNAC